VYLISVIIPVYNVQPYLAKCVDSVICQTYKNLEILLVDDGSSDGSSDICDAYLKDSRVKVIHKENGGLSDARNAGLEEASGDYIYFLDADDYIESYAFETMLKALVVNNADIVECRVRHVYPDNPDKDFIHKKPIPGIYNKKAALEGILDYKFRIVAWNKIYKAELWQNTRFPKGRYHEDEFTIPYIIDSCNRYVSIGEALYYYVQRGGSIMNLDLGVRRLDIIDAYQERLKYFSMKYKGKYDDIILYHFVSVLMLFIVRGKNLDRYKYIKDLYSSVCWQVMRSKTLPLGKKVKVALARIIPQLALLVYESKFNKRSIC